MSMSRGGFVPMVRDSSGTNLVQKAADHSLSRFRHVGQARLRAQQWIKNCMRSNPNPWPCFAGGNGPPEWTTLQLPLAYSGILSLRVGEPATSVAIV